MNQEQTRNLRRGALLRDLAMVKTALSRIQNEVQILTRDLPPKRYEVFHTDWMANAKNLVDSLDMNLRNAWKFKSREEKSREDLLKWERQQAKLDAAFDKKIAELENRP